MEIPSDVLRKLVCDNCEGHLSRGPVLMLADGTSRCGRCIEAVETAAAHRNMPCSYKVNGCNESVKFGENREHEETCLFRPLVCPIAEPGHCEWVGAKDCLLEHCRVEHPDNVKQNPFTLKHTIINSSLSNYILSEFQVLFLVQIKVCVTSRKIYHSVRLIGEPQRAPDYKFQIEIENNDKVVSARGDVTPSGCLTWQENTSLSLSINGLLELLGDFTDTTCKLTVRSIVSRKAVRCCKCNIVKDPPSENRTQKWWCTKCIHTKQECVNKFKGCHYLDDSDRYRTHELYHCPYATQCVICNKKITTLTLELHHIKVHRHIMHDVFPVGANVAFKWRWCILATNVGTVLCRYKMSAFTFIIHVWTPLKKSELSQYNCSLDILSPKTDFEYPVELNRNSHDCCDWYAAIYKNDTDAEFWGSCYHIDISFYKINV